jgi:hypothetical protein
LHISPKNAPSVLLSLLCPLCLAQDSSKSAEAKRGAGLFANALLAGSLKKPSPFLAKVLLFYCGGSPFETHHNLCLLQNKYIIAIPYMSIFFLLRQAAPPKTHSGLTAQAPDNAQASVFAKATADELRAEAVRL